MYDFHFKDRCCSTARPANETRETVFAVYHFMRFSVVCQQEFVLITSFLSCSSLRTSHNILKQSAETHQIFSVVDFL